METHSRLAGADTTVNNEDSVGRAPFVTGDHRDEGAEKENDTSSNSNEDIHDNEGLGDFHLESGSID
jgi:hypothetical protein